MKSPIQLIREEIDREGGDGLYCPDVPCGCLKDDLAPCGCLPEDIDSCLIGKRVEWKADEDCGCDGSGSDHFHICDQNFYKPSQRICPHQDPNSWCCRFGIEKPERCPKHTMIHRPFVPGKHQATICCILSERTGEPLTNAAKRD